MWTRMPSWRHRSPGGSLIVSATRSLRSVTSSRHWAGQIVARLGLTRRHTAREGRVQVVDALDELGYAPVTDSRVDRVALTRCALLQVASNVPEVVCSVHLGLVEELLEVSGADRNRARLTPFAEPGVCALRLMAPPATLRTAAVRSR